MNRWNERSKLTDEQHQNAVAQSRTDRDQTLVAMHALERALGEAAPGREQAWGDRVLAALKCLESALEDQEAGSEHADSLLSDIQQLDPRFQFRVAQLRRQWSDLRRTTASLRSQLEQRGELSPDYADIRQQLDWLLTALRHHRARETDLIYEAYNVDIGQVD